MKNSFTEFFRSYKELNSQKAEWYKHHWKGYALYNLCGMAAVAAVFIIPTVVETRKQRKEIEEWKKSQEEES